MKRIFVLSVLCVSALLIRAQDTIPKKINVSTVMPKRADTVVKRNGEVLFVVLTEVNPDDIRYRLYNYQDGPVFKLPKQEIKYVLYANGLRESYENYSPPVAPGTKPNDLTIQSNGWKYYYKGLLIKEPDMLAVTAKLHDKKIDLMISHCERRKTLQYITMIGGGLMFFDGAYLVVTNRTRRHFRSYASGTASTQLQKQQLGRYLMLGGLGCGAISVYLRFDRRHYAHMAMDLYNIDIAK